MRVVRWIAAIALVALAVYTVYVGFEGSSQLLAVDDERGVKRYCFTPEMYAGWEYEAVNYDIALDATLPGDTDADGAWDDEDCGDLRGTAEDEITTADGIRVAAWYIPAANGVGPTAPTILLAHGNPANKSDMLRYAQYLHADYNVVIPDLRNSGRSSGQMSTTGVLEHQEIHALLDWLVATKHPEHIGALGDSGGAATILMAARSDDRIEAFVTDSAHAKLASAIGGTLAMASPPHPPYPGTWAIQVGYWIRTGHWATEADPIDSVAALGNRPYLILHGSADRNNLPEVSAELLHAEALAEGVPVTLAYCEGATHGKLTSTCADRYAGWVLPFFADAFATSG
jgi:pimeloyl-ACP methyl ester carboxylesterase